MKAYISAEMRVVRVKNNIIATSMNVNGNKSVNDPSGVLTPQRKSIWE